MTVRFRFFVWAPFGLALALRAAEQAPPLPKESPFTPAAGAAATVGANEAWEFAAVQVVEQKASVYLYERPAKKGKWIAVGATVDGIAVKSYDATHDLVSVNIGGVDKTLALRKASASNGAAVPAQVNPATAAWNIPPPAAAPTPASTPVAPSAETAVAAPTVPQPPPPAPGTIAHQEQEARMLVSDLLEIGMAQRKAYEEAQKKAAAERAAQPAPAPTR